MILKLSTKDHKQKVEKAIRSLGSFSTKDNALDAAAVKTNARDETTCRRCMAQQIRRRASNLTPWARRLKGLWDKQQHIRERPLRPRIIVRGVSKMRLFYGRG
jgi:hypothetical protein